MLKGMLPLLMNIDYSHSHNSRYTELLHAHFDHSVLDSLPERQRGKNDADNDGSSMGTSIFNLILLAQWKLT